MIDRITIGAAALMGGLTVGTLAVRYAVSPARVRAVVTDASLDQLLGPWPEPAYGAAATQAWADCPSCIRSTAGVVHRDGSWTCGECLTPVGGRVMSTTTAALVVALVLAVGLVGAIWHNRRTQRQVSRRDQIIAESCARPERVPAAPDNQPGINLADHDACELLLADPEFAARCDRLWQAIRNEQQKEAGDV